MPNINDQILFSRSPSVFVGRITEVREKAVKVDYCFDSVWNKGVTVYLYTTWVPISVLVLQDQEIGSYTVKPWFARTGIKSESAYHIKRYYLEKGVQMFV